MKFNRRIVVLFGRDSDLLKLVKNNDEFAFMYMGGKDRPSCEVLEVRCQQIALYATMKRREGVGSQCCRCS